MKIIKPVFIALGAGLLIASFLRSDSPMASTFRTVGITFMVGPFFIAVMMRGRKKRKEKEKAFYLENGIKATAVLMEVHETGTTVNKIPELQFEFKVKALDKSTPKPARPAGGNGEEYMVTTKKCIALLDMAKLKEGLEIPAYIHPEDRQKLFFLWEKAGIETAFKY